MIVTKLEIQKKNPNRVNLYLDDNFAFGISTNTLAKYNIYVKKELNEEIIDEILFFDITNRLYDRALTYLSGAMKSKKQVKDKLREIIYKKKGTWFVEDAYEKVLSTIDGVLDKLEQYKFIDDIQYASIFVENRIRNKPRSVLQLKQELQIKGIDKDIIENILREFDNDQAIYDIYTKKYGDTILDIQDTKKVSFLARKGFSYDQINSLIRKLKDDTKE